ncbi:MAG: hypothetical protein RLZZ126_666 [Pseudomonadota bacterium]|jgi:ATP-dependent DNA helicase DinG
MSLTALGLTAQVQACLQPDSPLAQAVEGFRPRAGQTRMALAIAQQFETGGALVVEAGTGVGKTFSYLLPALLSGKRVLLSTATKNLQDQLFGRDLPMLVASLGLPVKTALLKGRSSYLCQQRLEMARHELNHNQRHLVRTLATIERWSKVTQSGDMAELPGLDERSALLPLVTSTRENCLGSDCPQHKSCHVNAARREALGADVVVINHHLFFADLAVRESGMAELLPSVDAVVFDEAHQLNEIGVQFLGCMLTSGQLTDLAVDVLGVGLAQARALVPWQELCGAQEQAVREWRRVVGVQAERHGSGTGMSRKLKWQEESPEGVHPGDWAEALQGVIQACEAMKQGLAQVQETSPDFVRLHGRAAQLCESLALFADVKAKNTVRWVESGGLSGGQLRLVESPLDIAQAVQQRILNAPRLADSGTAAPKTFVFTSATLGDDDQLSWFTEPCGLQEADVLRVGSPFDYATQAAVFVPRQLVKPNDPAHSQQVAGWVAPQAQVLGGRTLVLTTTLRALKTISEALQEHFAGSGAVEVLVQGQGSKSQLTERFREGSRHGQKGCVLVASASFWEGVDLPGDALQLLVIDKLPFPPPNDPLVEARSERLQSEGRSPFNDYFVPEAAVTLKQGAGRLIRRETDSGILVICDTRLAQMGYGARLLSALPPMRRLRSDSEFADALQALRPYQTFHQGPLPPGSLPVRSISLLG